MKAKGLWTLLETYPFPEDVRNAGLDAVTRAPCKGYGKETPHTGASSNALTRPHVESVGLKAITKADRARLTMYLEEIKRSDARRKLLEHEMKESPQGDPSRPVYPVAPGHGGGRCAVFLGELGNPEHFNNPRQIIKFAGYDPKENDSGLRVGRKIISKKGRWLLRKCLLCSSVHKRHNAESMVMRRERCSEPAVM